MKIGDKIDVYDYLDFVPMRDRDGVCVFGKTGYGDHYPSRIDIPDNYEDLPVVAIGTCAFENFDTLKEVTIPDTIEAIGRAAFSSSAIEKIVIPDSVVDLGSEVFNCCYRLKEATLGSSLDCIPWGTFKHCRNLRKIELPVNIKTIETSGFGECINLRSINLEHVQNIDGGAFEGCWNLAEIKVSNGLEFIGEQAFMSTSLQSARSYYKACYKDRGEYQCQNVVFQLGEWAPEETDIRLCERGYHYCTNLFEVFTYYGGRIDDDIVIFECEIGDKVVEQQFDTKCCTNRIKLIKRLYKEDIVRILNGGN